VLHKVLVLGEAFRPDIIDRLGLYPSETLQFDILTLQEFLKKESSISLNRWSLVLNLLPRKAHYADVRKILSQSGLVTVELNLGLFRKSLLARIKTLRLLKEQGTTSSEQGFKRGSHFTALFDIMSNFQNPPHYFLASAPRNLHFPAIASRKKLLVETFLQSEMKKCSLANPQNEFGRYVLFLDDAVATSADWLHAEGGPPVGIADYSQEIQSILGAVESAFGCEVIVAGHPGSKELNEAHKVFGDFKVLYGQTPSLIKGASIVATHQSTAIYQALFVRSECFLILPRSLQGSFYGALIESLGDDANLPVIRTGKEPFEAREVFVSMETKKNRVAYLRNFVGVPCGAADIRTTIQEILDSIEGR
jgi:hypothetical protein